MSEKKAVTKGSKKGLSWKKKDWIAAYIFIAPVTIGLLVFYIWPFIQNVWFSFNDVNKFNVATFNGIENYKQLVSDKEVWASLGTTLKYVVFTVPVGLFLSILIASLLNAKIKGKSIYRTLYFLPSVTMAAAVAMVWKWIYNEQMGILNSGIRAVGGEGHGWLTDPHTALFCIMLVGLWMKVGYDMIILLAGMQGIPNTYYEAAALDGAGPIQQIFQDHNSNADANDFLCNDYRNYQWFPGIRCYLYDDWKNKSCVREYQNGCYVVLPNRIRLWL